GRRAARVRPAPPRAGILRSRCGRSDVRPKAAAARTRRIRTTTRIDARRAWGAANGRSAWQAPHWPAASLECEQTQRCDAVHTNPSNGESGSGLLLRQQRQRVDRLAVAADLEVQHVARGA